VEIGDNRAVLVDLINQIHTLQVKCNDQKFNRNFSKIYEQFELLNLRLHNPLNESYELTRLDCDANFVGEDSNEEMIISEVIKPIIYEKTGDTMTLIQKAIVFIKEREK
jgi:carbonic anhydrase